MRALDRHSPEPGGLTVLVLATAHPPEGVAYDLVLLAHVATSIVGFGSMVATGVAAGVARGAAGGAALDGARRYFRPGVNWVGRTVYAVPVLGAGLVAMSRGAFALGDLWVQLGAALWVLAIVLAEAALWPTERRVQVLLSATGGVAAAGEPAGEPAGLGALCERLVALSACCGLVFLVAVVLMVGKP